MVGKMQTKNLHKTQSDKNNELSIELEKVREVLTKLNINEELYTVFHRIIQDQLDLCDEIHSGLAKLYIITRDKVPSDNHGLYMALKKQINLVQNTEMKLSNLLIMAKRNSENGE